MKPEKTSLYMTTDFSYFAPSDQNKLDTGEKKTFVRCDEAAFREHCLMTTFLR